MDPSTQRKPTLERKRKKLDVMRIVEKKKKFIVTENLLWSSQQSVEYFVRLLNRVLRSPVTVSTRT